MSNLKLIESLCQLVEQLIAIVADLSSALAQERSLTEAETASIQSATDTYAQIIGSDEQPDIF